MERQADLFGSPSRAEATPPPEAAPAGAATPLSFRGGLFGDAPAPPSRGASERQVSFASDISHALGVPLPLRGDSQSVGDFITRHRKEYEDHFRRRRQRP